MQAKNRQEDHDFNDRAVKEEDDAAAQRAQFMAALRGAISETAVGRGSRGPHQLDAAEQFTSTDCLDARTGAFTEKFREELRLIADQQLSRLEAIASRAAGPDLFGVLRRRCEACEDGCPGYQPQGAMCPAGSRELDFPTFCQNCGCPACFHLVVSTGGALPDAAAESLTGFNIRQSELNFNALLAVFSIQEGNDWGRHVGALVTLLRAEGLEVLSLEARPLDAQEALHLRSRQLHARDEELGVLINQGFDGDKARRAEEIRGASKAQSVFSATARGDLAALEREVRAREQSINRKAKRLVSGSKSLRAAAAKENRNLENMAEVSPERRGKISGPSWNDGEEDLGGSRRSRLEAGLQASVAPRSANKWLKLARLAGAKSNHSESDILIGGGALEGRALSQLMATIQSSKEISSMLVQPYLLLVVSSASQQNLGPRLRTELLPSFQKLFHGSENAEPVLRLAYLSGSKIEAVEDAVTFAPRLFRLQKSIILSEPSESPFAPQTSSVGATQQAARASRHPGGRGLLTLDQWYAEMESTRQEAARLRDRLLATEVGGASSGEAASAIKVKLEHVEQRQFTLLRQKPSADGPSGGKTGWAQMHSDAARTLGPASSFGGSHGQRATGLSRAVTSLVRRAAAEGRGATDDLVDKEGGQVELRQAAGWSKAGAAGRQDSQWTAEDPATNRMLRNFGTMLDFFDYSGVSVQEARRLADLTRPPALGFKLLPDSELQAEFARVARGGGGRALPKQCNLFAVAKVGTPNMIFPSTLDVSFRNYQDPEQYVQLCDYFFPEHARSQLTVIVIRPLIVQNGMSDLLVEILKANDFLILDRQARVLTKQEASYLCKLEKISKGNIELALDYAMAGPSEIVVVSKLGAVRDARTLCHGSETGRRRTSLIDEATTGARSNVDSVNALFEIAPFSSFNEFIDLQDFLVQHSRLHKYKRESREDGRPGAKAIDALAVQKIEEIRLELSTFQRSFSLAAVAAPSEAEARRQISLFCPSVAAVEEIVLVLNPVYNDRRADAEALLVRMQYLFVKAAAKVLAADEAERLLEDKFGKQAMEAGPKLIEAFSHREVHVYHLCKIAADREARALFARAGPVLEDHVYASPLVTEARGALLPESLPFLFLFMDTDTMFERGVELVHGPELSTFTASDFQSPVSKTMTQQVLETCLCTTAGEPILRVVYDRDGRLVPRHTLEEANPYAHCQLSGHYRLQQFRTSIDGQREAAQLELMLAPKAQSESSVSFIVEGETHHLYEVRIHKINHRGDVSIGNRFELEDAPLDDEEDEGAEAGRQAARSNDRVTEKRVRFADAAAGGMQADTLARKEILHFYEKFQALNFYYSQVNKVHGGGLAPSFYRFRLCPLSGPQLNRAFEVEEHVGRCFIDEVAEMHLAHQRLVQHAKSAKASMGWQASLAATEEQKSLPAFVVGRLIALLCKQLEQVQCPDQSVLEGAGELIYDRKQAVLRGRVKDMKHYFSAELERYAGMLASMKARWFLYLSNLETEIIEEKLELILDSLTFKYTRQPAFLSLVPDRIEASNLRVASTVKLLQDAPDTGASKDGAASIANQKFYKDVYTDPQRAQDLRSAVGSVLYTVSQPDSHLVSRPVAQGLSALVAGLAEGEPSGKPYNVTKHVCVAGVEPAKRPKYQLIASMLYLIDFHLRKVNRRTELFVGGTTGLSGPEAEREYDAVLDAMLAGIRENYGNDEINHVLDLVQLKRGGHDSLLEAVLREKLERQIRAGVRRKELEEVRKRARRNDTALPFLELVQQERSSTLARDQSEIAVLTKFLAARAAETLSGAESDQFQGLLGQTKSKLGSNAVKLAEEFVLKTRLEVERRQAGKASIQEKLSFVKMEYFLYAFTDAHRLMRQLQKFGQVAADLRQKIIDCQAQKEEVGLKQTRAQADMSRGANAHLGAAQRQLKEEGEQIKANIAALEKQTDDVRYQMAQRETELLLVFRELMQCDLYAPESYFDGDRLLRQGRHEQLSGAADEFLVPLSTFWRPVETGEHVVDPNSKEGRDKYMLYGTEALTNPATRGRFLADSLKGLIADRERQGSRSGSRGASPRPNTKGYSLLRQVEPEKYAGKEYVNLKKLTNPSFAREQEELRRLTKTLNARVKAGNDENELASKQAYDDPFGHVRNKELGNEIIQETIENFETFNDNYRAKGLNEEECRELCIQAIIELKKKNIKCEGFDQLNFMTSFKIYRDPQENMVDRSQLKNFVKSVAEL